MSTECETSFEHEDLTQYTKGGYHQVKENDILNSRYRVIKKIGWGFFSTVWLGFDEKSHRHVALKISKSAVFYSNAAISELQVLSYLKESLNLQDLNSQDLPVVQTVDSFSHRGPNGRHQVIIFEVLGVNLLEIIKTYDYKPLPTEIVKSFLIQILKGLDFIHKAGVIHTDLKLENIVVQLTNGQKTELAVHGSVKSKLIKISQNFQAKPKPKNLKKRLQKSIKKTQTCDEFISKDLKLKIIDFGNATYSSWLCNKEIQTRQYRAPEVILGFQYTSAVDIWSFGCIAFELITGELLFQPRSGKGYSEDEDHLASIWELIGSFPVDWASASKNSWKFFSKNGLKNISELSIFPIKEVLKTRYSFSEDKAEETSQFLLDILKIHPGERRSAEELLNHPWLNSNI